MSVAWTHGPKLRAYRKASGLSQQDAAVRCGVSLTTYGGWERGTQNPTDESIKILAEAMAIDPREIGYEPPEGWELVPSEWLRDAVTGLHGKLDELRADVRALKGTR